MANDITKLSLDALNSLSPQEKQLAIEILKQYSEQGESTILDQLQYADFDEVPVDIETFMHDEKYLGKALIDPEGRFTVFPYWEKTLKDIFPTNTTTRYNNIVFTGAIGLGKAQPLDSLVLTEQGYKRMGELTLEDKVYGNDGELHKIVGIFPQGKKQICRVTFSDGTSTLCCDRHLWTVKDTKTGKTFTAETRELYTSMGYSNRYEIPVTKPINFKSTKRYLKDFLYNEGLHIGKLCETAAEDTRIASEYLHETIKNRTLLLQGVMDAQGELTVSGSEIRLKVTNSLLADDITWLIQSLGGTSLKIKDYKCYRLHVHLPRSITPFRYRYKKRQQRKIDPPRRGITLIEYLDRQECQCILVDSKEHLYLTNDFIVTHNSTIAVICLLYMLYRLLCLKDPYLYYGMQPIDKITISLMNITLDNAKGVALDKMNQMILASEWFMKHGEMGGVTNLVYHPEKHIEVIVASSNNQIIGRALFCLDGETVIATTQGDRKLKDLVNKQISVVSVDETGNEQLSSTCAVHPTIATNTEYQIHLEDDSVIKCTAEHRLLLADNYYKKVEDLTEADQIAGIVNAQRCYLKIKRIEKLLLDELKQYYDVIEAKPYNNFLVKTNTGYIVSHNCNFTDEVNFSLVNNPEKQKQKMLKLITQIDARMKSRFMRGTYLPTLNILASSKDTEQSFLEAYIANKEANDSTNTLIVDEPQWVVDARKDSPQKFWVAIGNKFLANELVPLNATEEELDSFRAKGYDLWQVPMGYLDTFQQNLDEAICSIIGIATASSLKYISGVKLNEAKTDTYKNPFVKDVIEVGNSPEDHLQYANFFDLSQIDPVDMARPLFIHLDMSLSGGNNDKTGIAGVWISGRESNTTTSIPAIAEGFNSTALTIDAELATGNTASALEPATMSPDVAMDLHYKLAFSVSVKAPKGSQVSFAKNRNFIRWLRDQGFNIQCISTDTFQSSSFREELKGDGFKTEIISVDRVTKDASGKPLCLPYYYLKNAIYERRLTMYKKCDLLTDELIGLERKSDGHIDHTKEGINCLSGETLVHLTDGRDVTMEQLVQEFNAGKENLVYSFNHATRRPEARKIENAWCSGESSDLVQVTLTKGRTIICTANHRFMLSDGSYKMAGDLYRGAILMPSDPTIKKITTKNAIKAMKVTHLTETRKVYDLTIEGTHNFALTAGIFVHNSKDQADAVCLTGDTVVTLADGNTTTMKELYEKFTDGKWQPYVLSFDTIVGEAIPVQIQEVVNNGYKSNLVKVTLSDGKTLTCTDDHLLLMANGQYIEAAASLGISLQGFGTNRPKVTSVEPLVNSEEVFDLKLDKIHNFAIAAGIYVHNCGATWAASHFSDEYSYNYGDQILASLDANGVENDNYKRQQLIVDFEQELLKIHLDAQRADDLRTKQQQEDWQYYKDLSDGIIII